MKLLIVAGGGGHFAAALGVIEQLPKEWDFLVVGRKYTLEGDKTLSLELQTAKQLGLPFQTLTSGRLQRKFTRHTIPSLFKIPLGFVQAFNIVQTYRPDVVLSFGGYTAFPITYCARLLRIPLVLHEQTFGAGATNKFAANFAQKICISWKESEECFPREKVVLTGNPLRKEFLGDEYRHSGEEERRLQNQKRDSGRAALARMTDKKLPIIYITGGSSGAHALNLLVEGSLEKLLEHATVIHQTGDAKEFGDYDRLQTLHHSLAPELQKRYQVFKFVEPNDVYHYMTEAAVVVARSGINTVTELLSIGTPSLLIPLPYGQKNEQLHNAQFVKKTGLAEIAEQKTLDANSFYTEVMKMIHNSKAYKKHAPAAQKLINTHAAERIIEVVSDVTQQKKISQTQ